MDYLSTMPKKEENKRVEAHLNKEEYKQFEAEAKSRQWSLKKLNENVIREFLAAQKKKK